MWRLLLRRDAVITAGADASVKAWRLAAWLPAEALHAPLVNGAAAVGSASGSRSGGVVPTAAVSPPTGAASGTGGEVLVFDDKPPWQRPLGSAAPQYNSRNAAAPMSDASETLQVKDEASARDVSQEPTGSKPQSKGGSDALDSKGEWVRCIQVADTSTLYVTTQRGLVYRVGLPAAPGQDEAWTLLHACAGGGPLVSSCLLRGARGAEGNGAAALGNGAAASSCGAAASGARNLLCFGSMQGWSGVLDVTSLRGANDSAASGAANATGVASANGSGSAPGRSKQQAPLYRWQPHDGASVLGLFAASAPLPAPSVFSTSLDSSVRWWALDGCGSSVTGGCGSSADDIGGSDGGCVSGAGADSAAAAASAAPSERQPRLLAEAQPPAVGGKKGKGGGKVAAVEACTRRGLWLLGDHVGNVFAFKLPRQVASWLACCRALICSFVLRVSYIINTGYHASRLPILACS